MMVGGEQESMLIAGQITKINKICKIEKQFVQKSFTSVACS